MEVCNSSAYRDLSPWQIVAQLADCGRYLGSESSYYRVLKQQDLLSHRQKSRPHAHSRPRIYWREIPMKCGAGISRI